MKASTSTSETGGPEWNSKESLRLLQLLSSENDWSLYAGKLATEFGNSRAKDFFTAQSCKREFDRILITGHPEHFIRHKGEKYSQKDLIAAWKMYLEKQAEEEKDRESELLLVELREKASIFNRLYADDCDITLEEMSRLLEQARSELGECSQEELNRGMKKLSELEELHKSNPEQFPPLRIEIPPPTRNAATGGSAFSPIKPLFEGLIPPSSASTTTAAPDAAGAADTSSASASASAATPPEPPDTTTTVTVPEPPTSSGMSLRSSSTAASPQKSIGSASTPHGSPQKTPRSIPSSPQKTTGSGTGAVGGGGSVSGLQARSSLKDSGSSPRSSTTSASSPRVQKGSPIGRGHRSPSLASPTSMALRSSPRLAVPSSTPSGGREAAGEEASVIVKDEESLSGEEGETRLASATCLSTTSASADVELKSDVEMKETEVEKESDTVMETGDALEGAAEAPAEVDEVVKEKPVEKRVLRPHKEPSGSGETTSLRSSTRLQRGASRRGGVEKSPKTEAEREKEKAEKPSPSGHELRARRSSAASGVQNQSGVEGVVGGASFVTPVKSGTPHVTLRQKRSTERNEEAREDGAQTHRRRSGRRRDATTPSTPAGGEVPSTPVSVSVKRRWSAVAAEGPETTTDGTVNPDEDEVKVTSVKRRRLAFPDSTAAEAEKQTGAIVTAKLHEAEALKPSTETTLASASDLQSSPEPELGVVEPREQQHPGKKGEPVASEKVTPPVTSGRRGSLRGVAAAADGERGRSSQAVTTTAASVELSPTKMKEGGPSRVSRRQSDSDEEKTLGDIRERHRAARATTSAEGGGGSPKKEPRKETVEAVTVGNESATMEVDSETVTPRLGAQTGRRPRKSASARIRGRSSRSSVSSSRRDSLESPSKQTTTRRSSKKERLDETALGQRSLLMSTWRMVSSHRHAAIFAHPVQDKDAFGYSTTVKSRMDLSTLKKQIDTGLVRDMTEFKRRLLLMFTNAVMFNSTGHDVNIYAKEMAADTLRDLRDMEQNILQGKSSSTHITRSAAAANAAAEGGLQERTRKSATTTHRTRTSTEAKDDETAGTVAKEEATPEGGPSASTPDTVPPPQPLAKVAPTASAVRKTASK